MEKPISLINGGIRLPIGYRFRPTDEELVVHYLKRKIFSIPLPASVIPEFDVFQTDPWGLPGDLKEKRYFFGTKKRSGTVHESKCKRAAGSGYWKPIGKYKQILDSKSNQTLGIRRTLIFCERKRSYGTKTRWVMHEFRLLDSETNLGSTQVMMSKTEIEDWVVYRVFQRKKRPEKQAGIISRSSNNENSERMEAIMIRPNLMNYCMLELDNSRSDHYLGPPQVPNSSSCSSEITHEVSSNNALDQEETSCSRSRISSFSHIYINVHERALN
ncbi:hypothetical protein F2P56_000108 [Juglans regia]|uniref:NAC domain-containing protein n=2 Tax=Juglans regia TaxID=51240 RepID=A0A833Y5J4_JUGRE|nr:NAC domain-containing protein 83-like [Juglans regia]KAF5479273.1 hypothetical protein F2P56_000108 [Juglans regia]